MVNAPAVGGTSEFLDYRVSAFFSMSHQQRRRDLIILWPPTKAKKLS